ncbi:MAG: GtrA family protein [Candidatus Thorarchaeota archaeon]
MIGENEQIETSEDTEKPSFLSKARQKRFVKFAIVSAIGWGINELIVFLMMLLLDHFYTHDVLFTVWILDVEKILIAAGIAIVIVMIYNYFINKIWTFRKQEQMVDFATLPQFLKFALVGASGTVINLGLVHLFAVIIGWNDYLATTIGFVVSVITNFILNDIWTFNPRFGKPKTAKD